VRAWIVQAIRTTENRLDPVDAGRGNSVALAALFARAGPPQRAGKLPPHEPCALATDDQIGRRHGR